MSHTTNPPSNLTRRTVLKGTTAAVAISGLSFGLPGSAVASLSSAMQVPTEVTGEDRRELCIAHHRELTEHLKSILNSAYVDENTMGRLLTGSQCPHCKTALVPDMMDKAAFSALA